MTHQRQLHERYILNKERMIILASYANSIANIEESFWIKLASELAQKGDYVLYTNVAAPNEKVIPGTAPIVTTYQELFYLAEEVNCFIGLRSGIFDLLAFTNARLLYINRMIHHWFLRFGYKFQSHKRQSFLPATLTVCNF